MEELTNRFNRQVGKIEVSLIRRFDEQVSSIKDMIKLTLGEPDFNTPEHVKAAGIEAIEQNYTHYTGMTGLIEAREAMSKFFDKKYGITYKPETEILVTVGATQAISAALLAILEEGDKVLLPSPIYPGYEPIITLAKAEPIYLDTSKNNFVLTPEMIDQAMSEYGDQIKAIILNYPSNPTGVTYTEEEVKAIADTVKKYPIFVISDEIYSELTYDGLHISISKYIPERTIIINGLSKSHAMTGWRLGFILADEKLTKEIMKVHQYLVTAASTISQKAAIRALVEGIDDANEMKIEYKKRRDFVYEEMTKLGFEIARPNGAFYIFGKIPQGYIQNSMDFCVDLAKNNKLAIIPGIAFGQAGEGYVRISYAASMETLQEAMKRLTAYMNNKK
ncbi:aromatic amino acid aminotransferase [Niallia nealsonii]|uniref:Aminotransferase n=1 Tax=Niallia nealsonii TaxID=115979 RepID=A0A2N0YW81_9BACI|nr:pyridoxal phosphate-dependent aminotransferase [Niallia nealsonii]PKG21521.1 aromatic amino acid aminotransferase [Niallia nealsonii]